MPTLAAIVISGVVSLVDYGEAIYLWKVHKFDCAVWMLAFLGTLFLGVELGLGISVGISLFLVIFESAYPHTAILGRLPGTTEYRNIKNYKQAERYDGLVVVRIDAPIYFANTQNVREKVHKYERQAREALLANKKGQGSQTEVQFIILELSAVAHVDTSALHILQDMNKNFLHRNIQLCLSNPNSQVMQRLVSSRIADEIGRDNIFVSTHDAVDHCLAEMDSEEMSRHDSVLSSTLLEDRFPLALTVSTDGQAAVGSPMNLSTNSSDLSETRDIEAAEALKSDE